MQGSWLYPCALFLTSFLLTKRTQMIYKPYDDSDDGAVELQPFKLTLKMLLLFVCQYFRHRCSAITPLYLPLLYFSLQVLIYQSGITKSVKVKVDLATCSTCRWLFHHISVEHLYFMHSCSDSSFDRSQFPSDQTSLLFMFCPLVHFISAPLCVSAPLHCI